MKNLAEAPQSLPKLDKLRARLKELLAEAHDESSGTAYADWYDHERNLSRPASGRCRSEPGVAAFRLRGAVFCRPALRQTHVRRTPIGG
jgi:hypothetical protein